MKLLRFLRILRTFWGLDWAAKVQFTEALLLPRAIWIGFKTIGIARTQGWLRSWADRGKRISQNQPIMPVMVRTLQTQRTVRRITGIGGTCLVRSFALWAMLRRRGVDTDIRVGMRKNDGRVEGHAWLEYMGQPVNETESVVATYSPHPVPATFDLWLRA